MSINYQPQGIIISSSLAVNAGSAQVAINTPNTASISGFTLSPIGPTGSRYLIITGSLQGT